MKNKNIETDVEAKAMGCQITDYDLYRHQDRQNMILTVLLYFIVGMLFYSIGYINGLLY